MGMSKEVQEAIEQIRNDVKWNNNEYLVDVVVSYIDRLQKELEQEKEKNNRQLEIDTAEEVLKWKGKYHLLSRKINGVLEDKIKDEITYWKEAEKLGTRNDEEYYRAMCQYKYGVLEDILKESDIE